MVTMATTSESPAVAGLAALVLGATLGYGSPAVGVALMLIAILCVGWSWRARDGGETAVLFAIVLFNMLLVLFANTAPWVGLLSAAAGGWYAFARATRWWWFGAIPSLVLQVWVAIAQWHWGTAAIDVFFTLQSATEHLLRGANPYLFQYRDEVPLPRPHWVLAPFQYGPTTLYLGVPGRLLGDVRLLPAVALIATAIALVGLARRRGHQQLRRVFYLTASLPLFVPMIVNGWVDVYTAAGLAIWWALRERSWMVASTALGIGAAAKPVMLVGLVPMLVWDRSVRRDCLVALGAAVVLCVPFVIWTGPTRFVYAVAGVHVSVLNQPWPTSISFDAILLRARLPVVPDWVAVLLVGLSIPAAFRWRPAAKHIQLSAASVLMIAALLLSRQSFLNYYFVIAVWMLLAIAEQASARAIEVDREGRKGTIGVPSGGYA
jgi:hypothetical protein